MKFKYLKEITYGMMVFGLWPYWSNTYIQKLHSYFFIAFQAINIVSISSGFFTCEKSLSCYLETTSYCLVHSIGFYCAFMVYIKFDSIKHCLNRLHVFIETFGHNSFVEKGERQARTATLVTFIYTVTGTFLYNISAVLTRNDCRRSDVITAAPCGIPVTEAIPLNIEKDPQYALVFFILYVGGNFAIYSIVIAFLLPFSMVFHVKEQINFLKFNLRTISKRHSKARNYEMLKDCVKHHIYITTYIKDIQETFSAILLLAFASMSLSLSIYAFEFIYYLLNESYIWLMKCSMLLSGYCFIFTLFSMTGEICKATNEDLVNVIYDIPWYEQTLQSQYLIKFMLMRSQKPLTLYVKGMGLVDKELMSAILKTTYSYSTVLINLVFRSLE